MQDSPTAPAPRRLLNLFDTTSIIVGIIVGAAIFESTPFIAQNVPSVTWLVAVWVLGGLFSLIGGLCYAELATAYPQNGGDYVYLRRALGRPVGFLYAWSQLWVVRPGNIAALAFVFAHYANQLVPLGAGPMAELGYALAATFILSAINIAGVVAGKWTQNLLTVVKVLGLGAIVVIGLSMGSGTTAPIADAKSGSFAVAIALVLFAYGGWSEMALVAAEVRNPEKNILRAMILGTAAVAVVYLAVNLAFVRGLGFAGLQNSRSAAADVLALVDPVWGGRAINLLIAVSALGAINGDIFTGARVLYALGGNHRLYRGLGRWSARFQTPAIALAVQGLLAMGLLLLFGRDSAGFEKMVLYTTPIFWSFLCLVSLSLVLLRRREPEVPRPFCIPFYPWTPIVFAIGCLAIVYSSIVYAWQNGTMSWAAGFMVVGLVLALTVERKSS